MSKFTWTTSPVVHRYEGNPILSAGDMPFPSDLVYNAAVVKFGGRYVMMFRNLHYEERFTRRTHFMGLAYSDDGLTWEVDSDFRFQPEGTAFPADARMTVIEGRVYVCFADITPHGIRGTIAVTDDFADYEVLSRAAPDNRNMVLFPERIGGKFARLERPFPMYGRKEPEAFETWYSDSPDGRYWGNTQLVLKQGDVPFCNRKNGPAGQPIKTEKGWLTLFHATHYDPDTVYPTWRGEDWHKLYCVGIMMLDLEEPWRIVGLAREPLMVPEAPYDYETNGYRSFTQFPSATILEDDGTVRIYYGACDTVMALATAKLDDLIALCTPI
jgi:beta-1,4-mannooligosaccharide/beta-1,4-mannosyl-N-acetylglucosamine phosphorylase